MSFFRRPKPSNLELHARRELELLGEEPRTVKGYLDMIRIFSKMGHSGGSASVFIPTLNRLLEFKNLKPLTDDPRDWIEVGHELWQNRRNSEAFSTDGGKTYSLLSERTWAYDDEGDVEIPAPVYISVESGEN